VDEVGELQRVADEEDRGVVPHEVVVALLGVELDREAARVALGVGRALFAPHRGEASDDLRALAHRGQEFGTRVAGHVVGYLEVTVGPGPLGVDHPLRDAFAVEVGQLLDKVNVL